MKRIIVLITVLVMLLVQLEVVGYGGKMAGKVDMTGMEEDMTEVNGMRSDDRGLFPAGAVRAPGSR